MRPAIGPGYGQEIQEYERREWEAPRSIFRNHLLPGILPLTAVNLFFTVVGAVLTESLLSFFNRTQVDLSLGDDDMDRPGNLSSLNDGRPVARQPHARTGDYIVLCSAFYWMGRALNDVLNPRLRRR